jgi:hypothetical protein
LYSEHVFEYFLLLFKENFKIKDPEEKVLIFVHYLLDNKRYINCYSNKLKNMDKENNKITDNVCASINYKNKTEYFTAYLKQFVNQPTKINYYDILLNYPKINIEMLNENTKIVLVYKDIIKEVSLFDYIN